MQGKIGLGVPGRIIADAGALRIGCGTLVDREAADERMIEPTLDCFDFTARLLDDPNPSGSFWNSVDLICSERREWWLTNLQRCLYDRPVCL